MKRLTLASLCIGLTTLSACSAEPRPGLERFGKVGLPSREDSFRLVWWPLPASASLDVHELSLLIAAHPPDLLVASGGSTLSGANDGIPGGLQRPPYGEYSAFFMATPLEFRDELAENEQVQFVLVLNTPLSVACADRKRGDPPALTLGPIENTSESLAGFLSQEAGNVRVPSDWVLESAREIHTTAGTAYFATWQR